MSAAPGPRERLNAAIVAQLKKIKRENGYATEAGKNVFRIDLRADQLDGSAFPAIFVLRRQDGESYEAFDKNVYRATLPFDITGYLKFGQVDLRSDTRDQQLNALHDDVVSALLEDPTFGATCKDSLLRTCPDLVDADTGEGFFVLSLTTTYHFARVNL